MCLEGRHLEITDRRGVQVVGVSRDDHSSNVSGEQSSSLKVGGEVASVWCMRGERFHGVSPYERTYGFARAVRVGNVIHVAGTAPVAAPGSGPETEAGAQMLRCGEIVREAIETLGGTMADVVRTRMFIVDAADADVIGAAHREMFGASEPAATMVVVAGLLDPMWRVEIEVEAIVGS
jgi:enamine deaminase RidA (YjgF/YER057c/UK114 family)